MTGRKFLRARGDERAVDLWVAAWRKKIAKGDVVVVRYADDRVPRARKAERPSSAQLLN